ncbi:MAG TPA: hypothetical protein GXX14_13165 [Clostridiaceae bacterium]|nr:hypothetical protein [Clostridiaceae bacterium]
MKGLSETKQYLVSLIIQVIFITLFIISLIFVLGIEAAVLNPVIYIVPIAVVIIAIDCIILLFVYKKNSQSNGEET